MPPDKHHVALYGGAFNPPTRGHHAVVRRLLRAGFERVLVMPCHGHTFGKRLAPALDRLALARACFANLPSVTVSSFEIDARLGGSTYELLQHLGRAPGHAETEFFVVIGSDEANMLHRWQRSEELQKEARFVIIPRPGHPLNVGAEWARGPRHRILEEDGTLPEAASTEAREALFAGDAAAAHRLLSEPVLAEIRARRLYVPQNHVHPQFAHP